jgi:hypothetical protein
MYRGKASVGDASFFFFFCLATFLLTGFFEDCRCGLQMVFVPANGTSPYSGRPAVGYAASQCYVWPLFYDSTLLHAAMRGAPLTTTTAGHYHDQVRRHAAPYGF